MCCQQNPARRTQLRLRQVLRNNALCTIRLWTALLHLQMYEKIPFAGAMQLWLTVLCNGKLKAGALPHIRRQSNACKIVWQIAGIIVAVTLPPAQNRVKITLMHAHYCRTLSGFSAFSCMDQAKECCVTVQENACKISTAKALKECTEGTPLMA